MMLPFKIISQSINIKNTSEIYKGLKQGEYLKERLKVTENSLDDAKKLISSQRETIEKQFEVIGARKQMEETLEFQLKNQEEMYNTKVESLLITIEENKKEAKRYSTKSFWRGVKIGGITIGAAGLITLILIK